MHPAGKAPAWPFWSMLTGEEQALLLARATVHSYEAGTLLLEDHSETIGAVLVNAGRLHLSMIGSEGRSVMLLHVEAGECFLVGAEARAPDMPLGLMLETDIDSTLTVIGGQTLDYLLQHNPEVMRWAFRQISIGISGMLRAVQHVLFSSIHQRVAESLLRQCDFQNTCCLRITQERLAREASSSREVITRTLRDFAARGIVTLRRGQIDVTNPEALRRLAGEETSAKRGEQPLNEETGF